VTLSGGGGTGFAKKLPEGLRGGVKTMASWLEGITSRGAGAMAEKVAIFAEARNSVLADNIANIDTFGYKTRDLSVTEFQEALRAAAEESSQKGGPLALKSTTTMEVAGDGRMEFKPVEVECNLLFHDRGNRSVDREMSELAKNGMLYRVALEVLRSQNAMLETAISGRI
jgi:flagellar basal-body rod protein FlgB